ncbi:glutamic acid-rich protein isoform X2 [Aethina tumida]|uniref:glutamic acid-rich protein isoform X2 n=1 Tax=Aethina tumida TaxID=116153 RepID=UPI002148AE91|nr:glutamic acid-rich protein isoform X2 [Aethina tumida]
MAIVLKFSKPDSSIQWGFRLVGGADFETPLIVVKVNEDSIAEKAGLAEGDIIVRINETSTTNLTHTQAHDLLSKVGNEFEIGVRRGDIEFYQQWVNDIENNTEVSEILKSTPEVQEKYTSFLQKLVEEEDQQNKNIDIKEIQTSSGNIVITTEKQTVNEHVQNELTNDDMKTTKLNPPLADIKQQQEVNLENFSGQEATLDTTEKDRKWSTFLQRPKNPKPVPKKQEEERKILGEPYRVVIKKQKRKAFQDKKVVFDESDTVINESESFVADSIEDMEEADILTEGTEDIISDLEVQLKINQKEEIDVYEQEVSDGEENQIEIEEVEETVTEIERETIVESSLSLEEQLIQVQRQLQALSQLPSAIQVTLDAVSQQLAQIVGVRQQEEEERLYEENNNEVEDAEERHEDEDTIPDKTERDISDKEDNDNLTPLEEDPPNIPEGQQEAGEKEVEPEVTEEPESKISEEEKEAKRIEEEKEIKRQKVDHWNRIWPWSDVSKPIYRESNCYLVPSKVIASGRINFLKYQPPPKNLDYLQRSEVYKLVHDMDPPVRGISSRVEKILSEQDYVPHGAP